MGRGAGKKKKKKEDWKPWCWYCEREFEDEHVLINHQKAKHFKCMFCHKKMNTAGGLVTHCETVHKEELHKVPNAKPGREDPSAEIYGMEGIPAELAANPPFKLQDGDAKRFKLGGPLFGPAMIAGGPPYPGSTARPGGILPPPYGAPPNVFPGGNPPVGYPYAPPTSFPPPYPMGPPPAGMPPGVPPSMLPPGTTPPAFPVTQGFMSGGPPGTGSSANGAQQREGGMVLVYGESDVSMEEKRASLSRYSVVENPSVQAKLSRLDDAVDSRLQSLSGTHS